MMSEIYDRKDSSTHRGSTSATVDGVGMIVGVGAFSERTSEIAVPVSSSLARSGARLSGFVK